MIDFCQGAAGEDHTRHTPFSGARAEAAEVRRKRKVFEKRRPEITGTENAKSCPKFEPFS